MNSISDLSLIIGNSIANSLGGQIVASSINFIFELIFFDKRFSKVLFFILQELLVNDLCLFLHSDFKLIVFYCFLSFEEQYNNTNKAEW